MPDQSSARAHDGAWPGYAGYLLYLVAVTGALYALYANWAYDDPFIAYRYVKNLVGGAGFVYNPGEQVLSTTTPLYVLVLAAFSSITHDLPHLSNLIGAFCLACGGLLLWDLARSWKTPLAGWASLVLYPSFPLLAVTLGSEMPLYLALCLACLSSYARQRYTLAAVCAALLTLTRPDGALLALVLVAHYLIWVRKPLPWRALAWYAILILPWLIFAGTYFGSPIPVTLAAKQYQGSMVISQRFAAGLLTTFGPFLRRPYFWLELILAGIGFGLSFWLWQRWRLLWAWTGLYFAGYSLLGVSRYFWYYAPLVPGFVAAIGLGITMLSRLVESLRRSSPVPVAVGNLLAWLVILLLFWGQAQHLWRQAQTNDLRYKVFHSVGQWLATNTPPGASVGALEIGVIGYYAGRPVVDFAGLVQPEVAPQLLGSSSYEGAAQWAMERYRPDYLVLREKLFPELEAGYVARYCREVQNFPADPAGYPWSISVYVCQSSS
jgi:hypothetical protein